MTEESHPAIDRIRTALNNQGSIVIDSGDVRQLLREYDLEKQHLDDLHGDLLSWVTRARQSRQARSEQDLSLRTLISLVIGALAIMGVMAVMRG